MFSAEKLWAACGEYMDLAVAMREDDKTIVYANIACLEEYGDIVGKKCYSVFFDRNSVCPRCPDDLEESAEEHGVYRWEFFNREKERWYAVKSKLLYDEDADGVPVVYRCSFLTDVTDIMMLGTESVGEMIKLTELLKENERLRELLEYDAGHDEHTGLLNRGRYIHDLSEVYSRSDMKSVAAIYYDLNFLKLTNDKYGHEVGDKMIFMLSSVLSAQMNEWDNVKSYRFGGDEFVTIIIDADMNSVNKYMEQTRALIEAENQKVVFPKCDVAEGFYFTDEIGSGGSAKVVDAAVVKADERMYNNKVRAKKSREQQG
ncbi:hypothetical protein FACS1894120_6240 [Clostridia bacterium]|nr:hypothetical protein FACS1894120_6240 [Clostridia bacterium]